MSNGWTSPGGDSPHGEQGPPPGQPQYGRQPPPPQYGQYAPQQPQYGQYAPPQYGGGQPYFTVPPQLQLAPKPGVIPLRPLTLGDIFSGTFATIRGNPGATLGLSAIMALIVGIVSVVSTLALTNANLTRTDSSGRTVNLGTQYSTNITMIYTIIAGVILSGMLTAVVAEAVLGRRISIGDTWQKVRGRILRLIGLTALLIIGALLGVGIIIGVVVVLLHTAGAVPAVIAAAVLGIGAFVGLIFLSVRLSFASPVLVLERTAVFAALRRSWGLTRNQWWRIFGITLLAQMVVGVISQVVQVPGAILLITNLDSAGQPQVWTLLVVQLASVAVSAFTAPFTAGVTALLYLDQRIRKEALDVTLMAAAAKDGAGAR